MKKNKKKLAPILSFTLSFICCVALLPITTPAYFLASIIISSLIAYISSLVFNKEKTIDEQSDKNQDALSAENEENNVDESKKILAEAERALSEMARIYRGIQDTEIKGKINEIMRVTDKIAQDAVADPKDIPQIKRFFNYYLPTTIKMLHMYERMGNQNIDGENIEKGMTNINEMLDTTIVAFKKRLDSLFADQTMDIETDIEVMNTLLEREGLSGSKDF